MFNKLFFTTILTLICLPSFAHNDSDQRRSERNPHNKHNQHTGSDQQQHNKHKHHNGSHQQHNKRHQRNHRDNKHAASGRFVPPHYRGHHLRTRLYAQAYIAHLDGNHHRAKKLFSLGHRADKPHHKHSWHGRHIFR